MSIMADKRGVSQLNAKSGTFLPGENIPGGLLLGPPVRHFTDTPPQFNQFNHVEMVVQETGKSWPKKTYETHYLPRKTELSSFRTTSVHQVICCITNSVNRMWIGKIIHLSTDHMGSKA